MMTDEIALRHWRRVRGLTGTLLVVWALASFLVVF